MQYLHFSEGVAGDTSLQGHEAVLLSGWVQRFGMAVFVGSSGLLKNWNLFTQ